jgi:GT2 family glycosyltransferase
MNCKKNYTQSNGGYKLDIYILCRDRIDYLKECLESVLVAGNHKARIVISDNSIGDDVEKFIQDLFKQVEYVRRVPALDVLEHHNMILRETNAEYLVMFHDDDLMAENYVEQMLSLIEADRSLAAVGCNAKIIKGEVRIEKTFIKDSSGEITFNNAYSFIIHYLKISTYGPAPFSSYIYRMSKVDKKFMQKNQGGKYSDSSFLAGLLESGGIKWSLRPYIYYRIHEGNGCKISSMADRLSWFRWLNSIEKIHSSGVLRKYKIIFYYEWYMNKKKGVVSLFPSSKKERVVFKFLLIGIARELIINTEIQRIILSKIKKKLELYAK